MRAHASVPVISLFLFSLLVPPAGAATFSDVPSSHRFSVQIEELARMKVVTGNPDGTFTPGAPVNRAAMLTMLYRAKGWTPAAPSAACGKDVVRGAWYEAIVCDALAQKFVQGYGDGYFKPEQPVTRAEALKMTLVILGIPVGPLSELTWAPDVYKDVTEVDWHVEIVSAALRAGIIPLVGDSKTILGPNVTLTRGEAAAYVYGAVLYLHEMNLGPQVSSAQASRSRAQATASAPAPSVKDVSLPFSDNGTFTDKLSRIYRFTLKGKAVTSVEAKATLGRISCRLFRLEADGTSQEYYLGVQQGAACSLRVALTPGSYQLDIKPAEADVGYTVETRAVSGDGNDGFSEAVTLTQGKTKDGSLPEGDIADWYVFTLKTKGTHTLRLENEEHLQCVVYAMRDVDLFGFSGPECNAPYEFPAGTYYVGVMRGDTQDARDYAVWLE